ncbi:MAG: sugar transferase [Planctomycetota bacterium]
MSALPHPIPTTPEPSPEAPPRLRLVGVPEEPAPTTAPAPIRRTRPTVDYSAKTPTNALKRATDLAVASAMLVAVAPLLLAAAVWIKLTDGGPIIYRQTRMGHAGRRFYIYKLRTMRQDAEARGPRFATRNDSRVLPGCGLLRKAHIDELPQLINILRGDMSLVGPRPERPEIHETLAKSLPGFDRRLAVKPGLTGLAQVRNGYTNDLPGMRRKLALDLHYLRKKRFAFDAWLLLATVIRLWDPAAA